MKAFTISALLLVASCSAYPSGISSQYHSQDTLGQYSYGYSTHTPTSHSVLSSHSTAVPVIKTYVAPISYADHYTLPWDTYSLIGEHEHPWTIVDDHHHDVSSAGVPEDTIEVKLAKAAHFAAHAEANHHLHKRSLWAAGGHEYAAAPVIHNGVPVETPEVQHAKAAHFAAHAAVSTSNHHYEPVHHYAPAPAVHFAEQYAPAPKIHNGVPVETPEVQHAKAEHFRAVAEAELNAKSSPNHHDESGQYHHGHYEQQHYDNGHYEHGQYAPENHYASAPVIHNGVPVETPEVQHAKAAHFRAVAEAELKAQSSSNHHDESGQYEHGHYNQGHYEHGHYAPENHYAPAPVIKNGVPVETPEVQHAKAAHFAAVAQAQAHGGGDHSSWNSHNDGSWNNEHHSW